MGKHDLYLESLAWRLAQNEGEICCNILVVLVKYGGRAQLQRRAVTIRRGTGTILFGGIDNMLGCRNVFQFAANTWLFRPGVMHQKCDFIVAGQRQEKAPEAAGKGM